MSTAASSIANGSNKSLEVTTYSREYLDDLLDLLNLSLGKKSNLNRDRDYWNWKHEKNPFGRSIMLLGFEGKTLVGVRAFLKWRFHWRRKEVIAYRPVDSVTHPEARRRGIFSRLTTSACEIARQEHADFIFNTPNRNSKPGYLKLGWQEVGTLPVMMKMAKPLSLTWNILQSRLSKKEQANLEREKDQTRSLDHAVTLFENEKELLGLIDSTTLEQEDLRATITTDKTISYLKWRYTEHPQREYYTQKCYVNGKLRGAVIYRMNCRYNSRELMIDDILSYGNDIGIIISLLEKLINKVECEYIVAHVPAYGILCKALKRLKFRQVPGKGPSLVAKSVERNNFDGEELMNLSNWNLCLGDIEGL